MTNRSPLNKKTRQQRLSWLILISFLAGGGLIFRFFKEGVIRHNEYFALAENQYLIRQELPSKRGRILVGEMNSDELYPIASNEQKYVLLATPRNIKDPKAVAEKLSKIIDLPADEIFSKINNDRLYVPPIVKRLSEEKREALERLNLGGILLLPEQIRFYPEGNLASHVLGFVNGENRGQYGIEGYYNEELTGYSGSIVAEKDTLGRYIDVDKRNAPRDGADLVLTLDHNIQYMAQEKLAEGVQKYQAESGSIVIMNPKTGDILAMTSFPDYDPNSFSQIAKEGKIDFFINPATAKVWEPGSVFKPIVMAATIDSGKVQPETQEVFSNMVWVGSYDIHTARDEAFGRETMTQILENSDNVGMVWVANQLGNDNFYKYIKAFEFGEKTGIFLDKEQVGSVLDLKKWSDINRATMSFGQGISVTSLQMTRAISAIANKGTLPVPRIVKKIIKPEEGEKELEIKPGKPAISEDTARKLTAMMVSVVERGHAKKAQIPGYKVAGKTGTAQVPNPDGGYYEDRTIRSFGGFAPAEDPAFVMLVKLDNVKVGEFAESSAVPLWRDMAEWLLKYMKISPIE